jgi:speckle-type POZ protein
VYLPIKIADRHYYIPARSFSVLGYEWQIDYHANGFHPASYHDRQRRFWVKLRLTLVRGPSSDATAAFTFRLVVVDPNRTPDNPLPEVTECSTFRQGVPTEILLAPRAALKASGYLDGDENCFVQCTVTLFHEPDAAAAHPSRDLGQDLGNLLASQQGADVTFVVVAEFFRAHRCVLAARSQEAQGHVHGVPRG